MGGVIIFAPVFWGTDGGNVGVTWLDGPGETVLGWTVFEFLFLLIMKKTAATANKKMADAIKIFVDLLRLGINMSI